MRLSNVSERLVDWADAVQRKYPVFAFPYAVVKKYGDDDGGRHAALITYYGFLSLFPLLLVGVSVLSRVLVDHPALRAQLINAIVPPELQPTVDHAVTSMPSSGVPFAIGLLGALFAGTGVVFSAYETLNHVVGVPRRSRFGFVTRYLRVLLMLIVVMVGGLTSAVLTVASATLSDVTGLQQLAAAAGTAIVVFIVLVLSVKLLVASPISFRATWPGAAAGAVIVAIVLATGTKVLAVLVNKAGPVYGSFATVVGAFSLLYLASEALLYCAEAAIVHRKKLWPRGLDVSRLTQADVAVTTGLAVEQERLPSEHIVVRYADDVGPRNEENA
jgi:membrane protein